MYEKEKTSQSSMPSGIVALVELAYQCGHKCFSLWGFKTFV
jgi:hypothetical protein